METDSFGPEGAEIEEVILRTKGGTVTHYANARQLQKLPCVDLEHSSITDWIVPNVAILFAQRVVCCSGWLGLRHFVRDNCTTHVLSSDAL